MGRRGRECGRAVKNNSGLLRANVLPFVFLYSDVEIQEQ